MKKLILILLFIPLVSFGQDYGNDSDALKLCTAIQTNSFISDSNADNSLDRILSVIGASKRFVLQPCDNINNAVATSYKGIRYILYDKDFMDSLDSGDNWSNLFILAHEVGHHINGHSVDLILQANEVVEPKTLANKRQQELEADEFAGFILAKLGATLEQASAGIKLISSEKDDTYDSHPSKSKRLTAINKGYGKALEKNTINKGYDKALEKNTVNKGYDNPLEKNTVVYEVNAKQAAQEYFYSGYNKQILKDHYGAIADFTKAIELDSNDAMSYYNRGLSKDNLEDYNGAIADYSKTIELNPVFSDAYFNRGLIKVNLEDYKASISDFTKVIEFSPNDAWAYINRAAAKNELKDFNGGLEDSRKVLELKKMNFIAGSENDKVIAAAYLNAGIAQQGLNNMISACMHIDMAGKMGITDAAQWARDNCYDGNRRKKFGKRRWNALIY